MTFHINCLQCPAFFFALKNKKNKMSSATVLHGTFRLKVGPPCNYTADCRPAFSLGLSFIYLFFFFFFFFALLNIFVNLQFYKFNLKTAKQIFSRLHSQSF